MLDFYFTLHGVARRLLDGLVWNEEKRKEKKREEKIPSLAFSTFFVTQHGIRSCQI